MTTIIVIENITPQVAVEFSQDHFQVKPRQRLGLRSILTKKKWSR